MPADAPPFRVDPDRPAFSVIVPVYAVAGYLRECLDSILAQDADFELIAVDDASPDECPAILDEYAALDPRVRVLHLPANVGLGRARNAGLEQARGDYLVFVDSDDVQPPGTLGALAARIAATDRPDVVMFAFVRTYPDGRISADPRSASLRPEAVMRADARRDLLEIIPSAWNKAYRRDFVTSHGFSFAPGYYEDVPFTYPVLITAASIATLERVGYHYRQRSGGNILSSSGSKHRDLLDQYDRVFAYLDAHPELESWRRPLVDRLTRHVPTVLEADERVPPAHRRAFFDAASASFRRHRPRDYRPGGSAGLKIRLIEGGNYRAFRAAQLANQAARRVRRR